MTDQPSITQRVEQLEATLKLNERVQTLEKQLTELEVHHGETLQWAQPELLWLLAGFGTLGACVGFITGMTDTPGISKALMTGVMTFVGGSMLSYTGFRWRRGIDPPRVDPSRVGKGVFIFALAVILGAGTGLWARTHGWFDGPAKAATATSKGTAKAAKPGKSTPKTVIAQAEKPEKGVLRGDCKAPDLSSTAAGWINGNAAINRNDCRTFFTPYASTLAACGIAHLNIKDAKDAIAHAEQLINLATTLDPDAKYVDTAKTSLESTF